MLVYPNICYHVKKGYWSLQAPYTYYSYLLNQVIVIPLGFCYDLSSIPRILWPFLASHELGTIPPLIHDYMYRHSGVIIGLDRKDSRLDIGEIAIKVSRKQADSIFLEAMKREGVNKWKRLTAYSAVRLFGLLAWNKRASELHPMTRLLERTGQKELTKQIVEKQIKEESPLSPNGTSSSEISISE